MQMNLETPHFAVGDGSPVPQSPILFKKRNGRPVPYNNLLIINRIIIHSLKYRKKLLLPLDKGNFFCYIMITV